MKKLRFCQSTEGFTVKVLEEFWYSTTFWHIKILSRGQKNNKNRQFLVEYHGESGNGNDPRCPNTFGLAECSFDWGCKCQDSGNNTYLCLRSLSETQDSLFCQFSDDSSWQEFYDLLRDPYQLHNLAKQQERPAHHSLLSRLSRCKGQNCNTTQEEKESLENDTFYVFST